MVSIRRSVPAIYETGTVQSRRDVLCNQGSSFSCSQYSGNWVCSFCTCRRRLLLSALSGTLQQILPVVKENQLKVKAKIDDTKGSINDDKNQQQAMKKVCDDVRAQLTTKYDEALQKLNQDYAALSEEVEAFETKQNQQHGERRKQLELKLQSQENVLSLS